SSPSFGGPGAFFDPSGVARTGTVPSDKADVISIALHELGHGLGILSDRDASGTVPPPFLPTTFDSKVTGPGLNLSFSGAQAQATYGGPVPLTIGSYSHVGNGDTLSGDLMYASIGGGVRRSISALDDAILVDQGWVPTLPPIVSQVTAGTTT